MIVVFAVSSRIANSSRILGSTELKITKSRMQTAGSGVFPFFRLLLFASLVGCTLHYCWLGVDRIYEMHTHFLSLLVDLCEQNER